MHNRMSLWWLLLLSLSSSSLVVVVRSEKDGTPLKLVKTTLNKPPFEGGSALKLHWADGTLDARENVFDGGSKKDNGGMEARIVGGVEATGGRYPYYARVVMFDGNERIIAMCGGTVIHEDYVLSAAHCYENEITNFIDSILIIANYTQIMSRLGRTGFEQERYVQDVYTHPGYFVAANGAPNNDFLLLRLQQPTNGIRPVRLNDNDNVPSDEASLAVFGFGTLVTGGNTPLRLREVDLNVVPFSDCNDRNSYVGFINDETMLCAGQTGQGACQGDSGGPGVLAGDGPLDDLQVGVVSFGGSECGARNRPSVFARVSAWIDEIRDTVCANTLVPDGFLCSEGDVAPRPPPPPAEPACEPGESEIALALTTDGFASETSWTLRRANGATIEVSGDLQDSTAYQHSWCLATGCYEFTIADSFGDGLCCGLSGFGTYVLRQDGVRLNDARTATAFEFGESTKITVGGADCAIDGGGSDGGSSTFCFPGAALVEDQSRGPVAMQDLRIGDQVLVEGNKFETVYGFGHHIAHENVECLSISTTDPAQHNNNKPLELTPNHMVFVYGTSGRRRAMPASRLRIGDVLQTGRGDRVTVTRIQRVVRKGAYGPFTASGTIVVNGVLSSTYATLQEDSETLLLGGYSTGVSYQWIGRTFETPHRLVCSLALGWCQQETYHEETGLSNWIHYPYQVMDWALFSKDDDDDTFRPLQLLLVLAALGAFVVVWLSTTVVAPLAVVAIWLLLQRVVRVRRIKLKHNHKTA